MVKREKVGSGGIRTHVIEMTGALTSALDRSATLPLVREIY